MDMFGLLTMVGGLALFLYGMNAMGDGLAKMAGGRLEQILEKLTSKRIFALLLGAAVTAVIQSSSATTVMVVGFVNSGIMQLSQAVGIIMGANVGTTITSWLLSLTGIEGNTVWLQLLKPSSFSPVLAAVGIILTMSAKEDSRRKDVGNILLGFAILMFGMETMSDAVAPLADDPNFTGILTKFSNPVLGILAGAILTAAIQSSSASVGILQALCVTGAVSYGAALPIIMGQNIGTCVTALISSVGANKNAKRASMIHLYFNMIGTVLFMVVFYTLNRYVNFAFLGTAASPAGIAVVHSLFNIGCCTILFPFANWLVKLAEATIPDGAEKATAQEEQPVDQDIAIDERFLTSPAFAVEICRNMAKKMAEETKEALLLSLELLEKYSEKKAKRVIAIEQRVDKYEDVIGSYLVRLSSRDLSKKDSQSMTMLLQTISDWERISDHAANIMESAQEMNEKGLKFSKTAKQEISVLQMAVSDIVANTAEVFCGDDLEKAMHVEPLEEVVDNLAKKVKKHHVKRLQEGKCTIELGIVLEDVLTNLERVSDHCSNVAVEMIAIENDGFDTHEFFDVMSKAEKETFQNEYKLLKKKYSLDGEKDKEKKSKKEKKNKK